MSDTRSIGTRSFAAGTMTAIERSIACRSSPRNRGPSKKIKSWIPAYAGMSGSLARQQVHFTRFGRGLDAEQRRDRREGAAVMHARPEPGERVEVLRHRIA